MFEGEQEPPMEQDTCESLGGSIENRDEDSLMSGSRFCAFSS